jgi:hypothetical protein
MREEHSTPNDGPKMIFKVTPIFAHEGDHIYKSIHESIADCEKCRQQHGGYNGTKKKIPPLKYRSWHNVVVSLAALREEAALHRVGL